MAQETLTSFFTADHRACDRAWTELEAAVVANDQERARRCWAAFEDAVEANFRREEGVLFPAFESASGMTSGPTEVMRHEHRQMRGLLGQMRDAAGTGDFQSLLDHGDTFLMLMQQHNVKEEGVLFAMAERHLAGRWAELRAELDGALR